MADRPPKSKQVCCSTVLIAGLLAFPPAAGAQSDAPLVICNCSDYLLTEQIRAGKTPSREVQDRARENTINLNRQALDTAFEKYRRVAKDVDQNRQYLAKEKRDIEMSTAMVSDLVPVAPVNMVEVQSLWIVEQKMEANEKKLSDSRQALANGALGNLLRQNDEARDLVRSGDSQHAFNILFGQDSPQAVLSSPELTEGLDDAARNEVDAALTRITADNLTEVAAGLEGARKDIAGLREAFADGKRKQEEFSTAVVKEFEAIGESLDGLREAYDKLLEDSKGNSWRLENIERIMFDDLSPRQQYDKLKSGQFSSILASMDPEAIARLEKAKDVQTWSEDAAEWQSGLKGIVTIAENIGIDLGETSSFIDDASTLVMGALSIYSGTPMGVIGGLSAISGVFGGGGGQPSDARVLTAIKALERKIEAWHLKEMEAIERVAERIEEGFARTTALQQETLFLIDHVSQSIADLASADVASCGQAMRDTTTSVPDRKISLPLLERQYFAQHKAQHFKSCYGGLLNLFSGRLLHNSFYLHLAFVDARSSVDTASGEPPTMIMREHILKPMIAYSRNMLSRRFPKCSASQIDAVLMDVLVADPRRDGAVRAKLDAIENCADVPPLRAEGLVVAVDAHLDVPFNQRAIANALKVALETYPFMERIANIGGGENLVLLDLYPEPTQNDRDAMKNRLNIAIDRFRQAKQTGNLAIGQANLIIGDLVFEQLEEDLFAQAFNPEQLNFEEDYKNKWRNCTPGTDPKSRYWAAVCLLSTNSLMANNFARYLVRKHFVDGELTARTGYAFTLAKVRDREVGVSLLDPMFDRKMPVVMRSDDGMGPAIRFPVGEHRFVNPSSVLETIRSPDSPNRRFATAFDLRGDILLDLPDWGEAASTRQMAGSVETVRIAVALDRIEALIRNYEISIALPPEIRSMAQEAAVAAAWNPPVN